MEEEKSYNDIIITNLDQLVGELDDKIVEMRENNEEKGKIKGTQFKVINFKNNRGVGYARNYGAKKAKYNLLCYVDSDLIIS